MTNDRSQTHVALLLGGLSAEREISFLSGKAISKALHELGYKVTEIDMQRDIAEKLAHVKPDIVFNGLHGTYGEDGCIQGLLEIMGIPYTHSDLTASATAMHKEVAKELLTYAGIRVPKGLKLHIDDFVDGTDPLPRPYVIKPEAEGSSVGVFLVNKNDPMPTVEELKKHACTYIVESYIPGKELSVAVTDDEALGVIELRPVGDAFYDFEHKYTDGQTEHIMPAPISDAAYQEALSLASKAHKILGCRGISRADFRYDENGDGQLYLLEVNTHPGMTELSIFPEIAAHRDISFNEIIEYLIKKASCLQRA